MPLPKLSRRHYSPRIARSLYTAIAVVMTWPLMRHPSTTIASDLGDSLFVCWVLMWTSGQVLAALRGNVAALADYWNGNIFYPAPHTIAYSEHFTPQMLQMLPVYAAGGNILLCYNLLFLSTFVVAALGMYLFVRDITGRPLAAFLAGLAFAYAPYRLGQFPHLQVMSIGWMPLALLGLRRFFSTGRTQRPRRRRRRVRRPGAVVRILPLVFLAALCRVRTLRDDPAPDARSVARVAASRGGRARRRARAVSLPAAVSRRSRERRDRRALGGRCRDVRRGHARIRDDRPQCPTARQSTSRGIRSPKAKASRASRSSRSRRSASARRDGERFGASRGRPFRVGCSHCGLRCSRRSRSRCPRW